MASDSISYSGNVSLRLGLFFFFTSFVFVVLFCLISESVWTEAERTKDGVNLCVGLKFV